MAENARLNLISDKTFFKHIAKRKTVGDLIKRFGQKLTYKIAEGGIVVAWYRQNSAKLFFCYS